MISHDFPQVCAGFSGCSWGFLGASDWTGFAPAGSWCGSRALRKKMWNHGADVERREDLFPNGGFLLWKYPIWMVYNGKSYSNGLFRDTSILGNPQMFPNGSRSWHDKLQSSQDSSSPNVQNVFGMHASRSVRHDSARRSSVQPSPTVPVNGSDLRKEDRQRWIERIVYQVVSSRQVWPRIRVRAQVLSTSDAVILFEQK